MSGGVGLTATATSSSSYEGEAEFVGEVPRLKMWSQMRLKRCLKRCLRGLQRHIFGDWRVDSWERMGVVVGEGREWISVVVGEGQSSVGG